MSGQLIVIIPSRGRPESIAEMGTAFEATCTLSDTEIVFVIDDDDPARRDYPGPAEMAPRVWLDIVPGGTMVKALNEAALNVVSYGAPPEYVGFMGDDHRPRTLGWDAAYVDALITLKQRKGAGIVYGNDTIQGENLPTQVAMTSNIIRTLGYMAPPVLSHMYVDNFWRDLGHRLGILQYLPDVTIEHMHPVDQGKGVEWSEGHVRVAGFMEPDAKAWTSYSHVRNPFGLARDIGRVRLEMDK